MKPKVTFLVIGLLSVFLISGYAQEKKEPPTKSKTETKKDEKKLPELKERRYTIYGKERLDFIDADKSGVSLDIYRGGITGVTPLGLININDRITSGLKKGFGIFSLKSEYKNSVNISIGKYKDLVLGVNYGRVRDEDEARFFGEINRNSGFIPNSGYFSGDFDINYTRILNDYSSLNSELVINKYDYKFYSDALNGLDRKLMSLKLHSGLNFYKWERTKLYLNGVLSYFTGEDDKNLREVKAAGSISFNSVYSGFSLNGNLSYVFNSHDLENFNNELIDGTLNYNFINGHITGRKKFSDYIDVFAGIKYYFAEDFEKTEKIYPTFGFNLDLDNDLTILTHFDPVVRFVSAEELLGENRFLSFSTLPYYEFVKFKLTSGFRKKFIGKISAGAYLSFKEIENFGVYVLDNYYQKFTKNKGINFKLQTVSFDLAYDHNEYLSMMVAGEINNPGSIKNLEAGDNIPYYPLYNAGFNVEFAVPEITTSFLLNGNFTSKRFYYDPDKQELDSYFLLDLKIYKKLMKNSQVYLNFSNLLNAEFESWNGFREPDFMMSGGFKILW
ncbi:hypothetical protein ACFL4T_11845 [candidate division KSB1 bacterium]